MRSQGPRMVALAAGLTLVGTASLEAQERTRDRDVRVTCESDGRYRRCPAVTDRGVRLVTQLSQAACTQGATWGFDQNGIWVRNGCRAVFELGDPVADEGELVVCSSGGTYRRCAADTREGVRLVRQLSAAACVEGRTWGLEPTFIWVNGGCRAEFRVGRRGRPGGPGGDRPGGGRPGGNRPGGGRPGESASERTVVCESPGGFTRCPARFTEQGARLVRQLSNAACTEGRTWGYDRSAIWVTNGCRGIFEAGDPVASPGERVTCASDGRFARCPAETRSGVLFVRQLSQADCRPGETWGYERGFIWVDDGCRAEFRLGGGFAPMQRRPR